jgi:phosphatidylinositol alpha-1,6-mannosyltransferase
MVRRVLRGAQLLIANSHNTAEILARDWPREARRVRVLHPGVDTRRFSPAPADDSARQRLGWGDRQVILTVGRLQLRKGHDHLIQALPEVRAACPRVLYAIAGEGEERPRLERLVEELGLREHVTFLGALNDGALVEHYRHCDLFALPNRTIGHDIEGFGMVLLEAQSCGKPVLAGDSGGTRETLVNGETGRIVDCRTPATLAAALASMLADRQRLAAMGRAGREWVEDRFAWETCFAEAKSIFAEAAASPGVSTKLESAPHAQAVVSAGRGIDT